MEKDNKTLIMFVGKTHSGKTTFANEIKKEVENVLILEADPIAVFMKEKFPELRENDDREHTGIFKEISLKYKTFLLFLEFALDLGKPIILSNSNMWLKGRELVFELCKKYNYKVVGVCFDFPEEVLFERAKISERSLNVLRTSKDFNDLIINQRTRMQVPDPSEFDIFFTIQNPGELEQIKKELETILK